MNINIQRAMDLKKHAWTMHHWFNVTKNGSTKQKCKGSTLPPCATPVWIGTPVDLWLFAPSQERQGSGTTAWIWWTTRRAGKRMIYNNKQILFQCAELSSWQRIVKMLRIGQIKHVICCKCIQFWGINFNTLRPKENFIDNIFKYIILNEICVFSFIYHWDLFLNVQLTICLHWFR